ncbi:hypothetical protein KCU95_g17986, partial [Aureobasidium melanogenum]
MTDRLTEMPVVVYYYGKPSPFISFELYGGYMMCKRTKRTVADGSNLWGGGLNVPFMILMRTTWPEILTQLMLESMEITGEDLTRIRTPHTVFKSEKDKTIVIVTCKQKIIARTKHTAAGIPTWSPTVVLICRSTAYVWQSGRDAQFSADC